MIRDEKGRFVSTKNTTEYGNNSNNNSNKKENDTMMNAREQRMETLKNNGVNVDNFFDLSMRIPFGAEVKIVVDGKEMVIPASKEFAPYISCGGDVAIPGVCTDVCRADSGSYNPNVTGVTVATNVHTAALSSDPIVRQIVNGGYVFNSRVDGRFITAQTFKMLNEKSYNYKTRQYEYGWDAYLRNCYGFMYQFDMMLDELHKLAKMQRSNDPEFDRLSSFFTKDVVYETCKHYIRQLSKYVNNQPTRKYKGKPYVRLNKYGNVLKSDLNDRVFKPLQNALTLINQANCYKDLESALKLFVNLMNKLPYDTPKCSQWKDAFKGKGAYVTLLNIVKWHGVEVVSYETGEILNMYDSVAYVENKLKDYKENYWKFHELLKATIKANNFDLATSIESQK